MVNQKVFIGSGELYSRKAINWSLLRAGRHHNAWLQKEWNEFGENNFKFVILFECESAEDASFLPSCEREWIGLTQSTQRNFGYNIYKNASARRNFVVKLEMAEKISE